jgi:hypothetical protein
MKLCNKVNEFLEMDPPPDLTKIPVSLSEHINSCPDCRQLVTYFRDLPRDNGFRSLSASETGEFMKTFQKNALAEPQRSDPRNMTKMSTPFWMNLKWAFALTAFILVLFLGSSLLFRQSPVPLSPETSSFAVIKGSVTILSAGGKGESIALISEQALSQESAIKFNASSEPVELKYQNGGKVFLTGIGQMKVLKDGLNVETGKFNAKFKNLEGIMKVRVPCAVLAIRGTEIQFDIQPSRSEILLVEGAADLIPDNASQTTIRLQTGKRVRLTENTWVYAEPAPRVVPEEKPVKVPAEPVASESQSQISLPDDNDEPVEVPLQGSQIEHENENENEEGTTEENEAESGTNEASEDEEPDFIGREGFYD